MGATLRPNSIVTQRMTLFLFVCISISLTSCFYKSSSGDNILLRSRSFLAPGCYCHGMQAVSALGLNNIQNDTMSSLAVPCSYLAINIPVHPLCLSMWEAGALSGLVVRGPWRLPTVSPSGFVHSVFMRWSRFHSSRRSSCMRTSWAVFEHI